MAIGCHLHGSGVQDDVAIQIPGTRQLPCYAYFRIRTESKRSLRWADIAVDGRIDGAPVGYIWSHSYESIVDADDACIYSENRKESDFAS